MESSKLTSQNFMPTKEFSDDIDFKKYWLILKRRSLPAGCIFLLTVLLASTFLFVKKPVYQAEGKLRFKKNATSSFVTETGQKIGQLDTLSYMNTPVDTEAEVVLSVPILQKTIAALNLKDPNKGKLITPDALLKGLTVKGVKGTDILQITYKSKSPQEAAAVVNKLMSIYVDNNVLTNRAEAVAARDFIRQQLPQSEQTVRKLEADLRRFKEKHNIVDLDTEAKAAVSSISEIDSRIAQSRSQYEYAKARSAALQSKIGLSSAQALELSTLSQSPAVQRALAELQDIQSQLTIERTRFQDSHPAIVDLKNKEEVLKSQLQGRVKLVIGSDKQPPSENLQIGDLKQKLTEDLVDVETESLGFANQINFLDRLKTTYQQRANILPRLQQGQRDLERRVDAAQSTYQILLKNLQEVLIAEKQNVGNARVIAYALVPDQPVGPRKLIFLIAGLVVGGMLYIVTAFVLDLSDPSVKTAKDLRSQFRYTVLGLIPSWHRKLALRAKDNERTVPQLIVKDNPNSLISETYRMLQANLKFLSPDKELKVIAVTSSVSKEGKSTVSANLALAMAQLGRRVLLIDADLHHPVQHHIWDLTNVAGLSDVIMNRAPFETSVKQVSENLDVLPAGVIPPNPLALLESKRMESLIKDFSENYDVVLIDTPPLVLMADALTLGKMADGTLLVARPNVLDTASANAAKELLIQSGRKVLGLVINGVIVENEPDSYFHHAKAYYSDVTTPKLPAAKIIKKETVRS